MPAKGRALPGSCWWGWEGGCDPPCGIEMGMGAQDVTPQVPPGHPRRTSSLWDTRVLLPSLLWMPRTSTGRRGSPSCLAR